MRRGVLLCFIGSLYVCSAIPTGPKMDPLEYLQRFNYMPKRKPGDPMSYRHAEEERDALREFQHMAHIPETGVVDEATIAAMSLPRCGVPDKPGEETKSGSRRKRFATEGSRWTKHHLTYIITRYTNQLDKSVVQREIQRAFAVWSEVTPLKFSRIESGRADIEVIFAEGEHGDNEPFDGRSGVLAHAYFPRYGGDVHFDEAEPWTVRLQSGINLFQVAAHEIGHSLGLEHSDVESALMAPFYRSYIPNFKLHSDDITGVQSLYGRPTTTDTTTKRATTTTTTTTKSPTTRPTRKTTTKSPTTRPMRKTTTTTTTTTTQKPREDGSFDVCTEGRFDAITSIDGVQYGFIDDHYVMLTHYGIAAGYPKTINDRWSELPTALDAAVHLKAFTQYKYVWTGLKYVPTYARTPARTLFFKGDKVWSYSGTRLQSGYPKLIRQEFRGLPNDIDSAFVWSGNGKLYFTRGSQYYRYTKDNAIDSGYPLPLWHWRGLPSSVDAAFQDEHYKITYFFKENRYYRFDDRTIYVARANPSYPRPIDIWWLACQQQMGSLREGTNMKTELNEMESDRVAEDVDLENRLFHSLNDTSNEEQESTTQGSTNGAERIVHHVRTYVIVVITVVSRLAWSIL